MREHIDLALLRLGHRVASLRRERKMSREDLAYHADLSLTSILKIEHGTRNMRVGELLTISRILNYPALALVSDMLKGEK